MKRLALISLFLLLLTVFAQLQFSGEPLVVPGDQLGWQESELRLVLVVKKPGAIKLDLYSPGFDPNDYRSANELGDERYDHGKGQLRAHFALYRADGKLLQEKNYGVEPHRWDTLYSGNLDAGEYLIKASFAGEGKNAVAFRLNTPPEVAEIALQPGSMQTYNVHDHSWQDPFEVTVPDYGAPLRVGVYDGDGDQELRVRRRTPNGEIIAMPTPSNRGWVYATLREVGKHTFGFRRPENAYQVTNTVGIKVFYGPVEVSIVDTSGALVPQAKYSMEGLYDRTVCLQLPEGWRFVRSSYQYGKPSSERCVRFGVGGGKVKFVVEPYATLRLDENVQVCGRTAPSAFPLKINIANEGTVLSGHKTLPLKPGKAYAISAQKIQGATVSGPSQFILEPGKAKQLTFTIHPQLTLSAIAKRQTLRIGESTTITAALSTSFAGNLPATDIKVTVPEGLRIDSAAIESHSGPGVRLLKKLAITGTRPGKYAVHVSELPCGPERDVIVEVVAPNKPLSRKPVPALERSLDKHVVVPGEKIMVNLLVRNTGNADLNYTLRDNLPDCLESLEKPSFTGTLSPGETRLYHYPALARFNKEQRGSFEAELASNGGALSAPDKIHCVLVPLDKSVSNPELKLGDTTTFVIHVQNPTDHRLQLVVRDIPQEGLGMKAAKRAFSLDPGERGEWRLPSTPVKAGALENQALPFVGETAAGRAARSQLRVLKPETMQQSRESQVLLPFALDRKLSNNCGGLLIAHRPPANAEYVPGSSYIDGSPLPDPLRAPDGSLIWHVPARNEGTLTYLLRHSDPLPKLAEPELTSLHNGFERPLVGRPLVELLSKSRPVEHQEHGLIISPKPGRIFSRDLITVDIASPNGAEPRLIVNGKVVGEELLGEYQENSNTGVRKYTFHKVRLRPGRNSLQVLVGSDRDGIEVFLAGKPTQITVRTLRAIADGHSPIEIELGVVDSEGLTVPDGTIVVQADPEPVEAAAAGGLSGYRVRIRDGRALLRLKPISAPRKVHLRLNYAGLTRSLDLPVNGSRKALWLGHGSITARYDFSGNFEVGGVARAYLETPLLGGHFQGAVDAEASLSAFDVSTMHSSSGLDESEEPDHRFPHTGSAGEAKLPLVSDDAVAFNYVNDPLVISYKRSRPRLPGISGLPGMTALEIRSDGNLEVTGFAALLASPSVREVIVPDGSRVYWLSGAVKQGTEKITLAVGADEKELRRLRDYVIDYPSGVIFLSHPLWSQTDELLPTRLIVEYAPIAAPRDQLAGGAGFRLHLGPFSIGAAVATLNKGGDWSFGAETTYRDERMNASLTYSRASGGENRFGLTAKGQLGLLGARINISYKPDAIVGKARLIANLSPHDRVVLEHRARLTENRTEFSYERSLSPAFSVGAGAGYVWEKGALELLGRARYDDSRLKVELSHAHPLSLAPAQTRLLTSYTVDDNLTARADLDYDWSGAIGGSFGLEQQVGSANLAVSYVLPGESGEGNRARFGIRAPLPLSRAWSIDLTAGYEYAISTSLARAAAGIGVRYQSKSFKATLGVEGSLSSAGNKLTLRTGLAGQPTPAQTVGVSATYQVVPSLRGRFTIAYAYRGSSISLLTYHRLQNLKEDVIEGEFAPTWHPGLSFQLRPSFAYRLKLSDSAGNTYQLGLAGNLYFTRWLGIGAGAYYMWQPALPASHTAFNVEASLRAVDEVWINLGYTFGGFNGLSPESRPGIYLRIDLLGGAQ